MNIFFKNFHAHIYLDASICNLTKINLCVSRCFCSVDYFFGKQALDTRIFQWELAKLDSAIPEALYFKTIISHLPIVFKIGGAAGNMWFNF